MGVRDEAAVPTRRERQRQETLAEIKARAMGQVAEGGAGSVSLNAIARAMGMSPAALYRYFASGGGAIAASASPPKLEPCRSCGLPWPRSTRPWAT